MYNPFRRHEQSPYPMAVMPPLQYSRIHRAPPDVDITPIEWRRNVNASGLQDVQAKNGLGQTSRKKIKYAAAGYLFASVPIQPGQQRGDVGGFHKKHPSPENIDAMMQAGPWSQPVNPGGPGKIAATRFVNPMTG